MRIAYSVANISGWEAELINSIFLSKWEILPLIISPETWRFFFWISELRIVYVRYVFDRLAVDSSIWYEEKENKLLYCIENAFTLYFLINYNVNVCIFPGYDVQLVHFMPYIQEYAEELQNITWSILCLSRCMVAVRRMCT